MDSIILDTNISKKELKNCNEMVKYIIISAIYKNATFTISDKKGKIISRQFIIRFDNKNQIYAQVGNKSIFNKLLKSKKRNISISFFIPISILTSEYAKNNFNIDLKLKDDYKDHNLEFVQINLSGLGFTRPVTKNEMKDKKIIDNLNDTKLSIKTKNLYISFLSKGSNDKYPINRNVIELEKRKCNISYKHRIFQVDKDLDWIDSKKKCHDHTSVPFFERWKVASSIVGGSPTTAVENNRLKVNMFNDLNRMCKS